MSAPTGLIATPHGRDQFEFIETFDARLTNGVAAGSANVAYLIRVRPKRTINVGTIRIYVGTQSGNLDVGIYGDSGGATYVRLASSGPTSCGTGNAVQALTLSETVNLAAGVDYWWACARDNTTATLMRGGPGIAAVNALNATVINFGSSFPLPATLTKASAAGDTPCIWMRGS